MVYLHSGGQSSSTRNEAELYEESAERTPFYQEIKGDKVSVQKTTKGGEVRDWCD